MGRKSKLTPEQWVEVDKQILAGKPKRQIARDFGISESVIRDRETSHTNRIKSAADQIVSANRALSSLPVSAQQTAQNLAARLLALQDNLLASAHYGAANSHRLNALANTELAKVDDADPMSSADRLKSAMILTKAANDAATIGINFISANKDWAQRAADEIERLGPDGRPRVPDISDDPAEAARAYQRMIGAH